MSILKNENIICISWLNWDRLPLVMHHMMKRLSENNRILFVDPAIALTTFFIHPRSSRFLLQKIRFWLKGIKKVTESLYVYYPPPLFLQFGHLAINDRFNQHYLGHAINRFAKQLDFNSPILWLYDPYAVKPDGLFDEKLICYDCNDDISSFANLSYKKNNMLALEEELVKKAHLVFATSKNLYHAKKESNPNTYYFPSGVDFEQFHKALLHSCKIPDDVKYFTKPIIGFVGAITNYRINWEWIQSMSISRPEWTIVFIGPRLESPPDEILQQENIHFLGSKDTGSLAGYLKAFDVCIIPYKGETFLKSCQPTKTFEYLAAGKPVVSSYIPELEDYMMVVRLSKNENEFIANIDAALEEGKKQEFVQRCLETAKGNTWENRVEKISELIERALIDKISSH